MQDLTKEIIDSIVDKFCKNEISIHIKKDENNNQLYIITKDKEKDNYKLKRRISDKIPSKDTIENMEHICYIKVDNKGERASILFKSFLSIDFDEKEIYKYIKEFLAFVRIKIRQMNAWGIKVKLGLMTMKEFNELDKTFSENKELIVHEIFDDWKNKEITV